MRYFNCRARLTSQSLRTFLVNWDKCRFTAVNANAQRKTFRGLSWQREAPGDGQ